MVGTILGDDGANRLGRHDRRQSGWVAPRGTKRLWEFEGRLRHATADDRAFRHSVSHVADLREDRGLAVTARTA